MAWWISFHRWIFICVYMTLSMKSNFNKIFSQCIFLLTLHSFLLLFIFSLPFSIFFFLEYILNLCLPRAFRLQTFYLPMIISFSGVHRNKILRKIFYLKAITFKVRWDFCFQRRVFFFFDNSVTYGNIVLVGCYFPILWQTYRLPVEYWLFFIKQTTHNWTIN